MIYLHVCIACLVNINADTVSDAELQFNAAEVVYVRLEKVFPMRLLFIKVLKSISYIDTIRCLSSY